MPARRFPWAWKCSCTCPCLYVRALGWLALIIMPQNHHCVSCPANLETQRISCQRTQIWETSHSSGVDPSQQGTNPRLEKIKLWDFFQTFPKISRASKKSKDHGSWSSWQKISVFHHQLSATAYLLDDQSLEPQVDARDLIRWPRTDMQACDSEKPSRIKSQVSMDTFRRGGAQPRSIAFGGVFTNFTEAIFGWK